MDYEKLHTELWLWLAENPEKRKSDWPGWETISEAEKIYECFLCLDAMKRRKNEDEWMCSYCPVEWVFYQHSYPKKLGAPFCCHSQSLFYKWLTNDIDKKINIAFDIAMLPWR